MCTLQLLSLVWSHTVSVSKCFKQITSPGNVLRGKLYVNNQIKIKWNIEI